MEKIEIYKKNLQSISKYNSSILNMIKLIDFDNVENIVEEKISDDNTNIYFVNNQKNYLLHSRYDVLAEAKMLIKKVDFSKDSLIIVFGLGLGYHLLELKKYISNDTRVFVIEPNVEVLKYALVNVDLTEIFDMHQFMLFFGEAGMMDIQLLNQFDASLCNIALNMQIVKLPNYYIYEEQNIEVIKQINNRITNILISYGNDLDDMFVGFRNNYLNIDAIMKSNSIIEIRDKFKNKPAIIVASGPSLEKNLHCLKDAEGKALIIACDASLRACEKMGVKPDAIASIERDKPTYDFYYKNKNIDKEIVLVGPGVLWPNIYSEYKGKTIIMSKSPEGIENWWHSHFDNIEFVGQGFSCANVAFSVALQAGCNPIILIGQDLAYTDGRNHSDVTHHEDEIANDDQEADRDNAVVYLEDYEGNLLKSHYIYKIFKEWFETYIIAYPDTTVIDATEGGAYIKGSNLMTFEEAIDKYCSEPIEKHMHEFLNDVYITDNQKEAKYIEIIDDIKKEKEKLLNIKKEAKEHLKRLINIEKKYNIDRCNVKDLEKIIIRMQLGDKLIKYILNSGDSIRTYYKQIITQTIIFVKSIGNTLTNTNVKRNYELQKNLMEIISNSTNLIIDEYDKALEYILQKSNNQEDIL